MYTHLRTQLKWIQLKNFEMKNYEEMSEKKKTRINVRNDTD